MCNFYTRTNLSHARVEFLPTYLVGQKNEKGLANSIPYCICKLVFCAFCKIYIFVCVHLRLFFTTATIHIAESVVRSIASRLVRESRRNSSRRLESSRQLCRRSGNEVVRLRKVGLELYRDIHTTKAGSRPDARGRASITQ